MAGNTNFPSSADVFSANTPTPSTTSTNTADSTGRKHAERHDDMEAAMMAVQDWALSQSSSGTSLHPFLLMGA